MARSFGDTTADRLTAGAAPFGDPPFTVFCNAYRNSHAAEDGLWVVDRTTTADRWQLRMSTGGAALFDYVPNGSLITATSGTTQSVNAWFNVICWATLSGSTRTINVSLNNGAAGTNTSIAAFAAAPNAMALGCRGTGSGGRTSELNGNMGIWCAWDTDLDASERSALAAGIHPRLIRPASIIACQDLTGRQSPEIDPYGGFDLTVGGNGYADSPPLRYPAPARVILPAAVSVGGTILPQMIHAYYSGHA